jgi:hypothetical protein
MKNFIVAIFLAASASAAIADDLGVTHATFADKFHKAAGRMALNDRLVKRSCESNPSTKRTICTHKLGDFMMVMASSKGDDSITEITMICATGDAPDIRSILTATVKCTMAWSAAIAATSPDRDLKERAAIVTTLLAGLEVGESITIKAKDRKFVLQKSLQESMGAPFHIVSEE